MAVAAGREGSLDGKLWNLCRIPFWQNGPTGGGGTSSTHSSSSLSRHQHQLGGGQVGPASGAVGSTAQQNSGVSSVSSVAKSLLLTRRRLRLDPPNKLYFPYEPGKQVRSAIRIKNTSKSYVAFKFQTTAPKSCFMRPPGAILSPGEIIIATVFKFVEHPENNEKPLLDQKNKVKFKIMSLKVKEHMEYVPELHRPRASAAPRLLASSLKRSSLNISPTCGTKPVTPSCRRATIPTERRKHQSAVISCSGPLVLSFQFTPLPASPLDRKN